MNTLALVFSIIVVHLFYVGYVWPDSAAVIESARAAGQSAPRNFSVILKDWEQEICIIMMLWGTFLILDKCFAILTYTEYHPASISLQSILHIQSTYCFCFRPPPWIPHFALIQIAFETVAAVFEPDWRLEFHDP